MGILSDIFGYLWPRTVPVPTITVVETKDSEMMSDLTNLCAKCIEVREKASPLGSMGGYGLRPPREYADWCAGCAVLREANYRLSRLDPVEIRIYGRGNYDDMDQWLNLGRDARSQWLRLEQRSSSMLILAREGRPEVLYIRRALVKLLGVNNPWNLQAVSLPSFESTRSEATMHLVRRWLRDCEGHINCNMRNDTPVPTRVLDIGVQHSDKAFLYETEWR